jgi:hypothetical protein
MCAAVSVSSGRTAVVPGAVEQDDAARARGFFDRAPRGAPHDVHRMDEIGVESAPFPASGSGLDPNPIR